MEAWWLATGDVPGSNPSKGDSFSMKIKTGVDAVHESCPQKVYIDGSCAVDHANVSLLIPND